MERSNADFWITTFCPFFQQWRAKESSYFSVRCPRLATYEVEGNDPARSLLRVLFEAIHSSENCGTSEDPKGNQSPDKLDTAGYLTSFRNALDHCKYSKYLRNILWFLITVADL